MVFIKHLKTGASILMSLFFFACSDQKTCQNLNPVLNGNDYNTVIYKKAVSEALKSIPENSVRYYLDQYFLKDGNEYLVADIKSKDHHLCTKVQFLIKPGVFLADIPKKNGMGYRGAELKGIQYETKNQSDKTDFVITQIQSIID